MAQEYRPKGFESIFVYVREAHPGERYPAHRSMDQKLAQAEAFQQLWDVQRPILVDDLVGSGHRLYGKLPNMTYLIGKGGKVLFRADWTDPPTIRTAMDYLLDARSRRREGARLGPFYAELVGYRWADKARFQEGLERAGPQAIQDYAEATQRWQRSGPRPGRIYLEQL